LRQFDLETAPGGEAGLDVLESSGPFAVVVSDLRMPGMDGVQFLTRVKQRCPSAIRIMLTGEGDLTAASRAVNEGNIFRFLLKPCPSDVLSQTLEAALEQFRLVNAERELLEQTLRRSVEVLTEVMSLVNPEAFGRAHRLRRYVHHMGQCLRVPDAWQYEMAAMLSQIGSIAVPPEVLQKVYMGETLSDDEKKAHAAQYQVAYDLLVKIPRLEAVARMVRGQSTSIPVGDGVAADGELLGIRMLETARCFDELLLAGKSPELAIAKMRSKAGNNGQLVDALATLGEDSATQQVYSIRIAQLSPGMMLHRDVRSKAGRLLLGKGLEITPSVIARLLGFANSSAGVVEPLSVMVRR
jgi:CheY-like chemotaxis protein